MHLWSESHLFRSPWLHHHHHPPVIWGLRCPPHYMQSSCDDDDHNDDDDADDFEKKKSFPPFHPHKLTTLPLSPVETSSTLLFILCLLHSLRKERYLITLSHPSHLSRFHLILYMYISTRESFLTHTQSCPQTNKSNHPGGYLLCPSPSIIAINVLATSARTASARAPPLSPSSSSPAGPPDRTIGSRSIVTNTGSPHFFAIFAATFSAPSSPLSTRIRAGSLSKRVGTAATRCDCKRA